MDTGSAAVLKSDAQAWWNWQERGGRAQRQSRAAKHRHKKDLNTVYVCAQTHAGSFFGILGSMFVLLLMNGALQKAPVFLVMPYVMGVLGYRWWATKVRILADEVDDCGEYLLVKQRGEEDEVPLSNIINVNFSTARDGAQGRIRLTLDTSGKFGTEIIFAPPPHVYFGVTRRSEIAEDLSARIAQARLKRVGSALGQ